MKRTTILVLLLPGLIGCSAMRKETRHETQGAVVAACYAHDEHRGSMNPNLWPSLIALSTNIEVVSLEAAQTWSFAPPPPGGYATHSDGYGVFRMSLIPGEYVAYARVYDTWLGSRPFVIRADKITYVTMTFSRPMNRFPSMVNGHPVVSQK